MADTHTAVNRVFRGNNSIGLFPHHFLLTALYSLGMLAILTRFQFMPDKKQLQTWPQTEALYHAKQIEKDNNYNNFN